MKAMKITFVTYVMSKRNLYFQYAEKYFLYIFFVSVCMILKVENQLK